MFNTLRAFLMLGWMLLAVGPLQAQSLPPEPAAPLSADAIEPEPVPSPPPFVEIDWRLTVYRSTTGPKAVLAPAPPLLFRFAEGEFSGSSGCNRLRGRYTLNNLALQLGSELAITRMMCPEAVMQQEAAILSALQNVTDYRYTPDRLELIDATGAGVLGFARVGAASEADGLDGRRWQLDRYLDAQGALSVPLPETQLDLRFDARGQISGSDGCNPYLSGFIRNGTALQFGPLASTRPSCTETDGRAEQAAAYLALLGRVRQYRRDAEQLILLDATGTPLVYLRAVD